MRRNLERRARSRRKESYAEALGFLRTDLEAAMAMLEHIHEMHDPAAKMRRRESAEEAYEAALSLLPRLRVDEAEQEDIEHRLAALRERLDASDVPAGPVGPWGETSFRGGPPKEVGRRLHPPRRPS